MRSLTLAGSSATTLDEVDGAGEERPGGSYERTMRELHAQHHGSCLFCHAPGLRDLHFRFDGRGMLKCIFTVTDPFQGYDGIAHGGAIAAIIDGAMCNCLMGHGVIGYTTSLSVRYRAPMLVGEPVVLEVGIKSVRVGMLYCLVAALHQQGTRKVTATGEFFKKDALA